MDYFFALITGFALGVAARSLFIFSWPAAGFVLLLAVVAFFVWCTTRERWLPATALFLCLAALGAGRTMLAPQTIPSVFVPFLNTNVSLEGTVVADPDIRETNQHVTILIASSSAQTKILAFAPLYPQFTYGEKVKVSGTLEAPAPFDTDGGRVFRYDQYLAKDGIFAIIPLAHLEETASPSGVEARIMDALYGAKHAFVRGLDAALPEPSASLAEGLLAGGKQGLGSALIDAFTIAGLLQIVVLSGYNVMIVAEGALKAASYLPKRVAYGIAVLVIVAFIVAAGSGSSAVRAGIMACLALFARSTGRSYDALRALFLAVFLMLLWNPLYLVFDPGFQLSFAATLGLVLGTPYVEPYLIRIKSALLREAIATTVAAQVFVLPILLYQTGNLSLVSIPANLLVMPFVPIAMAASFIAGLVGMLVPFLAPVAGLPAYLLLSYIIAVGKYAALLPLAHVIVPAFPFMLVVLMYLALYALLTRRWPFGNVLLRRSS